MKKLLFAILMGLVGLGIGISAQSIIPGGNRAAAPPLGPGIAQAGQSGLLPSRFIYALDADNTIWVLPPCGRHFTRLVEFKKLGGGNLIGIDFRPSDGQLYGLTDTGVVYILDVVRPHLGQAISVGEIQPRFAGGYQSLLDFNPVVDAVRVIGSNDQNFALLLNIGSVTTVPQTKMAYAARDVAAGVDPNICAGSYTNNLVGARTTLFYGIDYDLNTFVTIAPSLNNGSSATGGGQLQTIGPIVDTDGDQVNLGPTSDVDIYTAGDLNMLVGVSGRVLFTIELAQITIGLPLGTLQNVTARALTLKDGGFIDVAVALQPAKCDREK